MANTNAKAIIIAIVRNIFIRVFMDNFLIKLLILSKSISK
jgi:hypothetical protein